MSKDIMFINKLPFLVSISRRLKFTRESGVLLINTVSKNREGFTRREYKGAQEARRAMHLLGFPLERYF